MGITYIEGKARGPLGIEKNERFLVDSGAPYSLLPETTWKLLGLSPKREVSFNLADGTSIKRKVSECYFILPHGEGHTPVILGESGDEALLGAVTLEILGLVLDPFKRTLHPMHMLLA